MAKLTAKLLNGEEFDIDRLDLDHWTPTQLIKELIINGVLQTESQLPGTSDGWHSVYGIVDKNNVKIQSDSNQTFTELGFIDGDTVRIIVSGCRPTLYFKRSNIKLLLDSGESTEIKVLDLDYLSPALLIAGLICNNILTRISHREKNDFNTGGWYDYVIYDKNNSPLSFPDMFRSFTDIGFHNGDTVKVGRWARSIIITNDAKLTVKLPNGEKFDIDELELNLMTPANLINQLIKNGLLKSEYDLPVMYGRHPVYGIIDKNNVAIQMDSKKTIDELGFISGDVIEIIILIPNT